MPQKDLRPTLTKYLKLLKKILNEITQALTWKCRQECMKNFILWSLSLLISSSVFAGRCQVEVTYHHQTGYKDNKLFELDSPSKADCEGRKKLYEVNTMPKKLKSKEVKIKWLG